jgi:nitrogen fixation/metabolism regulation signal transduction histidine kinase
MRTRDDLRIPWWGRLEARVIAALFVLGLLCVGASAYLVQLTVGYFDLRLQRALGRAQEAASIVQPFHEDLVDAHIRGYRARTRAMALELALVEAQGRRVDADLLRELIARDHDVMGLVLERADGQPLEESRPGAEQGDEEWFDATAELGRPGASTPARLRAVFRVDPEIDARYQAVGQRKREIERERAALGDVERAVLEVIGLASALVLAFATIFGVLLARATTRKVGALSRVMARVGRGDLSARSDVGGSDELGRLAAAFNHMLDELALAQERVAYLQRIGAWQEMARRIAHEIKNPLTPIRLAVEQLREKDPGLSPEFTRLLRTSVEIVEDEIEGLRRLVTSFSQFAKVPEVRREPVALPRLFAEFERAYGHLTDREQDALRVAPAPDVEISADRQLLKQVLVNLVENAVLSAREVGRDPVVVEVSAEAGRDAVEIRVDDNGPGVDFERREAVFEPYETTRETGTGLGLAIAKKVVLDHDGEVAVEDSPLGGARFVIRLPRAGVS